MRKRNKTAFKLDLNQFGRDFSLIGWQLGVKNPFKLICGMRNAIVHSMKWLNGIGAWCFELNKLDWWEFCVHSRISFNLIHSTVVTSSLFYLLSVANSKSDDRLLYTWRTFESHDVAFRSSGYNKIGNKNQFTWWIMGRNFLNKASSTPQNWSIEIPT